MYFDQLTELSDDLDFIGIEIAIAIGIEFCARATNPCNFDSDVDPDFDLDKSFPKKPLPFSGIPADGIQILCSGRVNTPLL